MVKHYYRWIVTLSFFAVLVLVLTLLGPGHVKAQPQEQYPILDMIANNVIQKYQQSSCEELWKKKTDKAPPSAEEQKVIEILKSDSQMRAVFINKVAGPIANKMFQCGMIP